MATDKSPVEEFPNMGPFDCREELFMHDWKYLMQDDECWTYYDGPNEKEYRIQFCRNCGILRLKLWADRKKEK